MQVELISQSDTICIICYDDIETDQISLKCNHHYHKKCIQSWIHVRMNCPICNRGIEREYLLEHGMEERVLNVIPVVEDEQLVLDEEAQRRFSNFLCMMLIIAVTSFLIGLGLII